MPIDPPPDLRISHLGYDRKHTSAEDINTYFPLQRLKEAAAAGRIGELNSRFYGGAQPAQPASDDRTPRPENPRPVPRGWHRCRGPGPDLTGLPPDRESDRSPPRSERHPHRRHGLRARHRRARRRRPIPLQRLPARQLLRQAGRPGEPARPCRDGARSAGIGDASPRTTVQSPYRWADDPSWKEDFYRLDLTPEQIAKARAEFDSQKAILKAKLQSSPRSQVVEQ